MIGTTSVSPLYLHDHGHAVGTIGRGNVDGSGACQWLCASDW